MVEGRLPIYQAANKVLATLHENRAVTENRRLTRQEVLAATGLEEKLFGAAYDHLRRSGYVMAPIGDAEMWVTTKGMEIYYRERASVFLDDYQSRLENLSRSLQQTSPPSPYQSNTLNNYGFISNSQFQQGTGHSSQTASSTSIPIDDLHSLLDEIQASLSALALNADDKGRADAAIAVIKAQLRSTPPNQGFVKESLGTLRRIFEGTASSAIGSGLAVKIAQFIAMQGYS